MHLLRIPSVTEDKTDRSSWPAPVTLIWPGSWRIAFILLVVAIAARAQVFGSAVVSIDEQFYSLVGGRMLHGALPFVDIFDRKPIGLFLIYAAAHLPGGNGAIAYHSLALICAWATAYMATAMARRVAPPAAALIAGVLYLLLLDVAGGEAGQAPVFYNLPVAIAAWIVMTRSATTTDGDLRRSGLAVMALIGLALQIKYTVVFEGIFLGLWLVATAHVRGRQAGPLAVDATLWILAAMVPTIAAAGVYAMLGHFDAWMFANVFSILHRSGEQQATVAARLTVMAALTVPLVLSVALRRWTGATPMDTSIRTELRFIDTWAACALLGVIIFGTWFYHYALPLFLPFAVAAAPLWTQRWGKLWLCLLILVTAIAGQRIIWRHIMTRGSDADLAIAVRATGRFPGCAFVYDGMSAFYDATQSCLPTTRVFPAHLQSLNEREGTGIDQIAEVRRIMAGRPARIMTMEPAYDEENLAVRTIVYRQLRHGYTVRHRFGSGAHRFVIYGRGK